MAAAFATVDEYIESFPAEVSERLSTIRAIVRAAVPDVEERISYGLAAFRHRGTYLVYVGGWKQHIGLYPVPALPPELAAELDRLVVSKGTVKLLHREPLPERLIAGIVAARLAELDAPG